MKHGSRQSSIHRQPIFEALENRELLSANIRPSIGGLTITPNPVAVGGTIVLVASGVADPEGAVAKVEFYRDSNGNGLFEKGIDQQVGLDGSPRRGWNCYFSTVGLPSSTYTFFARTRDAVGEVSKPAVATCTVGSNINFVGAYSGTISPQGERTDILRLNVTSQSKGYLYGNFTLVNNGIDCTFTITIGRNYTYTMSIAGEATGTSKGTFTSDGRYISGTFSVVSGGKTYAGTLKLSRP